ncbi:MAG: NADH-dependent [FeFe] hydrogenase, group A6 [Clostridia bacterium]|nr:NADH-dependent [FeFe] hydrogenase, group A6 [Clostridia bacterium]
MNEKMIKFKIDGNEVEVKAGETILDGARKLGIDIPTLCFLKEINEVGACRMCLVEVEGARGLVTSCVYPATEGMIVKTNTPEVNKSRKMTLELLLSNHNKKCLTCVRNTNCELQNLSKRFGLEDIRFAGEMTKAVIDESSKCIERDTSKCILCGRCVSICSNVQTVSALTRVQRGFNTYVGIAEDMEIAKSTCVGCGQCVVNCPTGALKEKDVISEVIEMINDPEKIVIVQTAPSIRAALGEEFGMPIGTLVEGQMVTALKRAGFNKIFDTDFAADVTIMEEGTEFLQRLEKNENIPMITSCSSGWITFAEKFFPDLLPHLSTSKSPMSIMGTLIKTDYAKREKIDPSKIYSVAIMPCSAKKAEIVRPELEIEGRRVIDAVLTTRELARMLKQLNIDIAVLPDSEFDNPLGEATGAGHIFGVTGGVMEAALRTINKKLTGETINDIAFETLRGKQGIKEAKIKVAGKELNIAVAQGLGNCRKLLEEIADGKSKYHFIEVMTCPGGCIMGGGQPIKSPYELARLNVPALRAKAIYKADEKARFRISCDSESVKKLYDEFLGEPNGKKAHELLHTSYNKQEVYMKE